MRVAWIVVEKLRTAYYVIEKSTLNLLRTAKLPAMRIQLARISFAISPDSVQKTPTETLHTPNGIFKPSTSSILKMPSNDNGLKNLPKEIAMSYSGCGFLGTYHFGVMTCFKDNSNEILSNVTRFAGASAGSLVAMLMVLSPDSLDDGLQEMYDVAEEIRRLPLGALSPGFLLVERLRKIVDRYLPDDVSQADDRLFISITRQKNKTNRIISKFPSKEYLAQVISASCYIPIYSGGMYTLPPMVDGELCIDGGYSNGLPGFGDIETISVSPFSGSALIAPHDKNVIDWKITRGRHAKTINHQNIIRGAHSLFPPSSKTLEAYYNLGYDDGLKFLIANDFLENRKKASQ